MKQAFYLVSRLVDCEHEFVPCLKLHIRNLYTKGFPSIGYSRTHEPFLLLKIMGLSESCESN